jgi:tetratricopeptide (TPR) repeat protein
MLDEAVDKLEEALKIYRDLSEKDERFLPDLARTLNNLGNALSKKEMLDEAVDKLEEALKIYRDLSEKDERFLPYLAAILINLGNALSKKEMFDEAVEHLCAALKMLTDERAPKTPISEKLLEICISHLKKILEELIPEECRKKLVDILHRQS